MIDSLIYIISAMITGLALAIILYCIGKVKNNSDN